MVQSKMSFDSFLQNIVTYLKRKAVPTKPLHVFMLSPADSAGSGSRIRDAVRSITDESKITIHLVTWRRRRIGYGNSDIVLSDGVQALQKAQRLLDMADIVHFKDDNPPLDGMYGLKMPPMARIIHTAGGSGFRRKAYPKITENSVEQRLNLPLNDIGDEKATWHILNDAKSIIWKFGEKKLEIDTSDYRGNIHVNLQSQILKDVKNAVVIRGDVQLNYVEENSGFKVCNIIVEHFDYKGSRINRTLKRFGALKGHKLPWCVVFNPLRGQAAIRITFNNPFVDKSQVIFDNLQFLEMTKDWNNTLNRLPFTEDSIANKLELNLVDIGDKNASWWMINDDKNIKWSSDNKQLEINTLDYVGNKHINIRSKNIAYIKGNIVIYGDVELREINNSNKIKVFTVIAEYLDKNGVTVTKIQRKFKALCNDKASWFVVFDSPKKGTDVRLTFHFPNTEKTWFTLNNLNFLEMLEGWNSTIQPEKIQSEIEGISMGLWPLKTYQKADLRTVLTPDLLIDGEKLVYTPHGFPVYDSLLRKKQNKRCIITHAPSNSSKKGTETLILPALKRLSEKYDFEISLVQGMPHKDCLAAIQKSDLFIDQVLVGFYGNAALEAMAYGIPTVAYLDEKILDRIGVLNRDCPIVAVKRRTENAFVEALEPYLKKPYKLKALSKKTRKWVGKRHDYSVIGRLWRKHYRRITNPILNDYYNFREKINPYF